MLTGCDATVYGIAVTVTGCILTWLYANRLRQAGRGGERGGHVVRGLRLVPLRLPLRVLQVAPPVPRRLICGSGSATGPAPTVCWQTPFVSRTRPLRVLEVAPAEAWPGLQPGEGCKRPDSDRRPVCALRASLGCRNC